MRFNLPSLHLAIAHPDAIVAVGLAVLLRERADLSVSVWETGCDGVDRAPADPGAPDILITDHGVGIAALASRRLTEPHSKDFPKILIVTQREREWDVRSAMNAGAHGYLLQNCAADELIDAVRSLGRGSRYICRDMSCLIADSFTRQALTQRETEVLCLLADGACNKAIAKNLGIAVGTVKAHLKGILEKLGASTRTHAVVLATQRGLVPERPAAPVVARQRPHTAGRATSKERDPRELEVHGG